MISPNEKLNVISLSVSFITLSNLKGAGVIISIAADDKRKGRKERKSDETSEEKM
jgi:hypothetical protein